MPHRKKPKSAPTVIGVDRIGALPDHMLHHVLSFLPVQLAVRTCMLARRWRNLWRSTTGLRIAGLDDEELPLVEVQKLRKFMDHLLVLRERTDLHTVKIKLGEFSEDDVPYVNLWTRFAVMCKVRALTIHLDGSLFLCLDDPPLVSRHLRTLHLEGVALQEAFLYFAFCPALEVLKMSNCDINAGRISSLSLKHLSIIGCRYDLDGRVHVSTPGLVSLKIFDFSGRAPFLGNMPLLERACVYLTDSCEDGCLKYGSGASCGANDNACKNCVRINDDCSRNYVLLGGISGAKHLDLLSESTKFILTRNLKHCPTFSKLKTLLLDEYWCHPDLNPLHCILENSPVLEKLTLQLFSEGPNHKVEMKGSYNPWERSSAISLHLNIVEVKCNVVDEKILKVLKFLCAFNIRFSFE